MADIRISIPRDLKEFIDKRVEELGMTNTQYFRTLAKLDISVQRYQSLVTYINMLYNNINEYHQCLNIYATPLQETTITQLD